MDIIIHDTQSYEIAYESLYELCNVIESSEWRKYLSQVV